MGRLLKLGCLGIIGLVVVVGVIAAVAGGNKSPAPSAVITTPTSAPAAGKPSDAPGKPAEAAKPTDAPKPTLAQIGQTVSLGGWEITLADFGPYEKFSPGKPPATKAQGKLVVADMKIKNLQNTSSNFTTGDFSLKSGDGRTFQPSGQTASIERGFLIAQTVQPGLTTENRVVFDVDPAAKDLTFNALKMVFSVPNP